MDDETDVSDTDVDGRDSDDDTPSDTWKQITGFACNLNRLPFTVVDPGSTLTDDQIPSDVLGFFELFFTNDLIAEFVTNTNAYAAAKLANVTLRPNSIWNRWRDVTVDEMKAYLGVVMNMAMNDKPSIFSYFSPEWTESMPFFVDVFPRYRFLHIHWMLHAAPVDESGTGKAQKVQNVLDCIREKCLQYYIPHCAIAVDETTIAFKGRVSCKMYNPQKPTKWGLRVYVLCKGVDCLHYITCCIYCIVGLSMTGIV